MKYVISSLLIVLVAFVGWPYFRIYQIDDALGREDPQALAPLVDLAAVRAGTVQRLDSHMQAAIGPTESGSILGWVQENLRVMGSDAVDQVIDLQWVRTTLQQAVRRVVNEPPYYFMRGIDFAFFDGFDSFQIRVGRVDQNPIYVQMRLRGGSWIITGIYN